MYYVRLQPCTDRTGTRYGFPHLLDNHVAYPCALKNGTVRLISATTSMGLAQTVLAVPRERQEQKQPHAPTVSQCVHVASDPERAYALVRNVRVHRPWLRLRPTQTDRPRSILYLTSEYLYTKASRLHTHISGCSWRLAHREVLVHPHVQLEHRSRADVQRLGDSHELLHVLVYAGLVKGTVGMRRPLERARLELAVDLLDDLRVSGICDLGDLLDEHAYPTRRDVVHLSFDPAHGLGEQHNPPFVSPLLPWLNVLIGMSAVQPRTV
eukprot:970413-Prymnesium_polylepis.1